MQIEPRNKMNDEQQTIGISMGVAIALGVAIGAAMDNVGLGIAIGVAIGAAIGAGINAERARKASGENDDAQQGDSPDEGTEE